MQKNLLIILSLFLFSFSIQAQEIIVFIEDNCNDCENAEIMLYEAGFNYEVLNVDMQEGYEALMTTIGEDPGYYPVVLYQNGGSMSYYAGYNAAESLLADLGLEGGNESFNTGDNNNLSSNTNPVDRAQEFVDRHNYWRRNVGITQDVTWSDDLAAYAQEWADKLASGCDFEHRSENTYGENLYMAWGMQPSPKDVVDSWGEEIKCFDENSMQCICKPCGHYTQIVWETSTQIGCAYATCADGAVIVVCNYNPPGNWVGQAPYTK